MDDPIGFALPDELLSADEEVALARQIEAGMIATAVLAGDWQGLQQVQATEAELIMLQRCGELAEQRFVKCNLRLVAMVSRKEAVRSGLAESDLFQEGCLGLIEAVRRFDHGRGLRFATYALYWIRAYIGALTANRAGKLNLPSSRAERARELRGAEAQLAQQLGRQVSAAELAVTIGRSTDWVARLLSHQVTQSLDEADLTALDLPDDRVAADFDAVLRVGLPGREVLVTLGGCQRQVIELRFGFADGDQHSYSDISRRLGVPVTTVRREEARALEVLRGVYPHQARVHL
jgi:RNA polymerase sigma factor (sigma-70 family)